MRHDDEEPGKLMARKHAVVMVCRVCGLRAKGVMDRWGRLRLSDRVRPKPGAEPVVGLCEGCEEKQMAEINEEVRQHREQSK